MPFADQEQPQAGLLQHVARRLSIRRVLLLLVVIALLPLGILGFLQGLARYDRDDAAERQRLTESALLTAFSERNIIGSTQSLLRVLSTDAGLLAMSPEDCTRLLADVEQDFDSIVGLSLIDADGRIRCASRPLEAPVEVGPQSWWARMRSEPTYIVTSPLYGTLSRRRVIWALQPLLEEDGTFAGAVTASIDLDWLAASLRQRYARGDAVVILLDQRGQVVLSSRAVDWTELDLAVPPGDVATVRDSTGNRWSYAIAPLYRDERSGAVLHIAYAAPHARLFGADWWFLVSYFALPLLALLFASVAIWLGTNWAILRWITDLRTLSDEYGRGNYRARVDAFAQAPREIRDLAASLYRMGRTVETRDRLLTEAVDRQTSLAREIHHRVKNNLQIIISMLALQARGIADPTARHALEGARLRVAALALVHRLVYESGELANVSTRRLFFELVGLLRQHFGTRHGLDLRQDVDDGSIDIDTAVPLALWLVEAVTAMAAADEIHLRLVVDDPNDRLDLTLTSTAPPPAGGEGRLLSAIARQLGGTLEQTDRAIRLLVPRRRQPGPPGTSTTAAGSFEQVRRYTGD